MMKRRIWLALMIAAAACSKSPTQPTTPPAATNPPTVVTAIVEQWRGLFDITSCTGQGGDCTGPKTAEFMLTLTGAGFGLEGVLVLLDKERTTVNVSAPAATGTPAFTAEGYSVATNSTYPVRTAVSAIDLRFDAATGLTGSMTYTNTTFRSFSRTVKFRSAVRQTPAERPGAFHGTWEGYYRTLSCTGECQIGGGGYNFPTGGILAMAFSATGAEFIGSVMSHAVAGTVQAGELQGSGAALTADLCEQCWDCEGVCQSAVRTISARVDTLGRMTGTFEYSRKGWTGRKDEHFRQTMIVEMVSVTRRW